VLFLIGAVIDFVAIGIHANEQCENRCGFVATQNVAVISERRETKIVSILARNAHKLFQTST
jgi:hypothetical protein